MNKTINKFLLAGGNIMPERHLKQPRFVYSACGPFIKIREKIQKFKETGDSRYIYKKKLDEAYFQHDMGYGNFKDLLKERLVTKYYLKKHLILLKLQNMMEIKENFIYI